jgi:hypothetical protein
MPGCEQNPGKASWNSVGKARRSKIKQNFPKNSDSEAVVRGVSSTSAANHFSRKETQRNRVGGAVPEGFVYLLFVSFYFACVYTHCRRIAENEERTRWL